MRDTERKRSESGWIACLEGCDDLIVETIGGVAVVGSRRLDRLVLVLERLALLVVRWRQQVAVVIDRAGLCDSPLHHVGAEVIAVAQVREADDVIFRFAVGDERYARYDFDSKALCEERALFGVHLAELRLDVLRREDPQVLVDDLAAFGCIAVEVTNDVLRLLRHLEELFLVDQLGILAVALKANDMRCN